MVLPFGKRGGVGYKRGMASPSETALERYRAARQEAFAAFLAQPRIQPLWRALTQATDALLAEALPPEAAVTLIAVGGYGRSELFPFSDVDLLLLVPEGMAPRAGEAPLIALLQQWWDQQVPISHATRTAEETIVAARGDATIAAALMDARYVAGDRAGYRVLKRRLRAEVMGQAPQQFVAAKLAERDKRHRKWGDSRFMLEPNIKEGKGGLRDLHTLTWLSRYCYGITQARGLVRGDLLTEAEWKQFREAYLFFSTLRALMHLTRGRAEERLGFDLQTQCATALHFPGKTTQEKAEALMLRYFHYAREVGMLTRIFCAVLEEEKLRVPPAPFVSDEVLASLPEGIESRGGRLQFSAETVLAETPVRAVTLFLAAQQTGLSIHPRARLLIHRALPELARRLPFEAEAQQGLLRMMLSSKAPEAALTRMRDMGVLGAVIPEFGRIIGMMQYDGYHTYTVDEHTLVAIGHLAAIEAGAAEKDAPLSTRVAREISERAALYVAMLCHDIAKGTGGAHAEKGEAMVEHIARRLGLGAAPAALAAWLVKHHLYMSETATKRDLDDPQTLEDFVARVQSPERLRLLLLLTVADIKAVGPKIWNPWKGGLLRDLFHRAMGEMGLGLTHPVSRPEQQARLLREVAPGWQAAAARLLAQALPASWWHRPLAEQLASIEAYGQWLQAGDGQAAPALVMTHDPYRAVSEVTIAMPQQAEGLRVLAGAMAWSGASIVSARSLVLGDGVMIATFAIQDAKGESFAGDAKRLAPLPMLIARGLRGAIDFASELPKRRMVGLGRAVEVTPSVFMDTKASAVATVLEVNARDRIGLLYTMLGALAECQLQVMTAHIATYGTRAVDVFYVKDAYGMKVDHPAKLAQIERVLLEACG